MSDRHRTLREIFPGAICALDGTLVHAVVPITLTHYLYSRVYRDGGWCGSGGDKYYLCDASYANTRGFMAPYRSTRNVIERAYGVLKAKFPILKQMASYKFEVQRDVVIACFAIHNFIRKCNIQDHLFEEFDEDSIFNNEEEFEGHVEEEADATQWGA
ncbi:putative nuclease HARBI1 [Tanacetum coccineum]